MSDKVLDKLLEKVFVLEQEKSKTTEDAKQLYELLTLTVVKLREIKEDDDKSNIDEIFDVLYDKIPQIELNLFGRTSKYIRVKGGE